MIAKTFIETETYVNFDKLFDLAGEEFSNEYLLPEDKEAFTFALKFLKDINWNAYRFPEHVNELLEIRIESMYRNLCNKCPHRCPCLDDDAVCKYFKECGAGEILDCFVDYLEKHAEELKKRCKV